MTAQLTRFFPFWLMALVFSAYCLPSGFVYLKDQLPLMIAVIMLSMGLTLSAKDFMYLLDHKAMILFGLLLQYLLMPSLAFIIATLMQLPEDLLVGLVLVGSVAGGTASNVMCYLAKGDVALSITLTALSTLLSVVLTPLLVELYIGQEVHVPVLKMLLSMIEIVLLPVALGVFLNQFFNKQVSKIKPVLPVISMFFIALVVSVAVALNKSQIQLMALSLFIAIVLHNGLGLGLAYAIARLFKYEEAYCRAIAIEVGMQNSGLAVALSLQFFNALTALPGAVFSVWHNISGSLLASYWGNKSLKQNKAKHK